MVSRIIESGSVQVLQMSGQKLWIFVDFLFLCLFLEAYFVKSLFFISSVLRSKSLVQNSFLLSPTSSPVFTQFFWSKFCMPFLFVPVIRNTIQFPRKIFFSHSRTQVFSTVFRFSAVASLTLLFFFIYVLSLLSSYLIHSWDYISLGQHACL